MRRHAFAVSVLVLALASVSAPVAVGAQPASIAQFQSAQGCAPAPGRLEKLRLRTKETWAQMKRRWSLQREKYAACRKEARQRRLAGRKTRKFLEECMSS
ncbi:MAG TPA: hypothetical protein VHA55_04695 [Pseudorhodoplanes sp.]|nr:hypothetical protein [Pseudorhodoplanes sp.]